MRTIRIRLVQLLASCFFLASPLLAQSNSLSVFTANFDSGIYLASLPHLPYLAWPHPRLPSNQAATKTLGQYWFWTLLEVCGARSMESTRLSLPVK